LRHAATYVEAGPQRRRPEGEKAETSCAGFAALDPLGREIGTVEQLFADLRGEPKHLRVEIGGLFARRSVLIPVREATIDRENRTLELL